MSWNDERVALLKKLWSDGLTASQCAAELGGITRNAVIGKVHRLGLEKRGRSPSGEQTRARKSRAESAKGFRKVPRRAFVAVKSEGNVSVLVDDLPEAPIGPMIDFNLLIPGRCKFTIGDPGRAGFGFCGHSHPENPKASYCPFHSRFVYVPAAQRKKAGARAREYWRSNAGRKDSRFAAWS